MCLALALLVAPASAGAQWRVVDEEGNDSLRELVDRVGEGNVNQQLKALREQQRFPRHQVSEHSGEATPPPEVLDAEKPSVHVDIGIAERCPAATRGNARASQQQLLCEEMFKTELALYRYSLRMYEVTRVRNRRLAEIESERARIGEAEPGRLQDNSNKLLGLLSRMEIDRQQHQTYMDAYQARLRNLAAARDTLAAQALDGDRSPASKLAAIGSLATLAAALQALQTEREDWRRHRR